MAQLLGQLAVVLTPRPGRRGVARARRQPDGAAGGGGPLPPGVLAPRHPGGARAAPPPPSGFWCLPRGERSANILFSSSKRLLVEINTLPKVLRPRAPRRRPRRPRPPSLAGSARAASPTPRGPLLSPARARGRLPRIARRSTQSPRNNTDSVITARLPLFSVRGPHDCDHRGPCYLY